MAGDENNSSGFQDLLSAALDESGIGDLASFGADDNLTTPNNFSHASVSSPVLQNRLNENLLSHSFNNSSGGITLSQHKQISGQIGSPVVLSQPPHQNVSQQVIRMPQSIQVVKSSGGQAVVQIPSSSIQSRRGIPTQARVITISKCGQQSSVKTQTVNLGNHPTGINSPKIIISTNSVSGRNSPLLTDSSKPLQLISQLGLAGGNIKLSSQSASNYFKTLQHQQQQQQTTAAATLTSSTTPAANGTSLRTQLTNKDVSRLWSTEDLKLKSFSYSYQGNTVRKVSHHHQQQQVEEEEGEEEVEELGQAETYSEYMPSKLKIGEKHPDSVVESSSLSSVDSPNVWFSLSLPENTIDSGHLSALQLEAVVYGCQRHETIMPSGERAGFLIGDGAGVGKGRTVAGIIFENYLQGRKRALWFSVSNDLKVDAERDLKDIGASKIDVHPLNKFKYAKISSKENGSVKKGVIFATYSSLIGESQSGGKYKTRLKQLLRWCGENFDGVIVFDECHRAKNLCPVGSSKPTKTGQTVLELQNRLPKGRVIYASATGASEPKNMAYMTRLGLWGPGTPFKEFSDFIQAVERRGVGAMELVAMDMKLRGMYIARQLSFQGVTFRIEEIPLQIDFVHGFNESVKLWVDARDKFQKSADLIGAEQRMKKSMWGQFWSAHQRFFKYLCISAKVGHCVKLAREAVKNGKCVVIGLQSTGEARTLEQLEDMGGELTDFVSTAKGVFQTLVDKHFPAPDRRKTMDMFMLGGSYSNPDSPNNKAGKKRKKDQSYGIGAKKYKGTFSDDGSGNNDLDSSDFSDLNLSESESSESGGDSDDFNPFGVGSDSDDDPWLKKSKAKTKTKKKEEVNKKKKKKKEKKKENNVDEKFDKALEALGLLKKNNTTNSRENHTAFNASMDDIDKAIAMKRDLQEKIEKLTDMLPPNTLDHLIDELGGPENVAEMTGRKGRVVTNEDGGVSYESRSEMDVPLEILNLTEKQRFMDGEKNIAIISEAASSGISLQADRRALNQKRRVHITLELPWSADRAIQQFGRTHRSNQVNAPEYVFLISDLAGERRFASTVAKRLESLGALTHGDRRATETRDLSRFNFDNKYGRTALEAVMKSVLAYEQPLVVPPSISEGDFFEEVKTALIGVGMIAVDERNNIPILEKEYNNISKFLNRILGMPVELQNSLFKYFSSTLTAIVLEAKRNGRWDMGILDLGSGGESVRKLETKVFVGDTALNKARTELHTVSVERGMSWNQAMEIWRQYTGVDDGFYLSTQMRNGKKTAVLSVLPTSTKKKERLYNVYRPNTGLQPRAESLADVKKKFKKVLPDEARVWWEDQYQSSASVCIHAYWKGNCKKTSMGLSCEVGLRSRTYHVLSGSVLSVWSKVESVLASLPGGTSSKMQIIRLKTDDGHRIVGSLIPGNCLNALSIVLSQDSAQTYTEKHTAPQENIHLSMPMII